MWCCKLLLHESRELPSQAIPLTVLAARKIFFLAQKSRRLLINWRTEN
jgi:hypothetical protein